MILPIQIQVQGDGKVGALLVQLRGPFVPVVKLPYQVNDPGRFNIRWQLEGYLALRLEELLFLIIFAFQAVGRFNSHPILSRIIGQKVRGT